jgi:AcrR family transcriptional regulator
MTGPTALVKPKTRDAERSRGAILRAAETSFAERGFSGASLNGIAAAAGLSRGAPNYFFGSKQGLYLATLEKAFADREAAAADACLPLHRWAEGSADRVPPLERPLRRAVSGYLDFLLERPSFATLLLREELDGGSRLRQVRRESQAVEAAFAAVRSVARQRGLKQFDPRQAVLVFVSLTFSPVAQRATFMTALEIDLADPAARRRHVKLVVDQLLRLLCG